MNPNRLLELFDRISEAPDASMRLRQFILDLAVQGKLVEQDPVDKPASELVKAIQTEKEESARAGEIKRVETFDSVNADEIPFPIPAGWKAVRMGWLARKLGAGSTPLGGKTVYQNEGVPFLRSQNVHNNGLWLNDVAFIARAIHERMAGTHVRPDDVLLNITGASIGRCALVPIDFKEGNVSQHVAIIRLFLPDIREFIHLSLISPFFQKVIDDVQVGVSREGLSMQRLRLFPMLLPPLAEQRRIVARVNELMDLCDQLEKAKAGREETRDLLAVASLCRLDQPADTPEAFCERARFYFNHLPRLTTKAVHIKQLRQTILNLAVRGKLVHQDSSDEPVPELLKRIQTEKERLSLIGELLKEEPIVPIQADAAPVETPNSWAWVRLGALAKVITKGSSPKWQGIQYVEKGQGILFVTSENVGNYHMRKMNELKYVEKRFNEIEPRSILEFGDVLMNLVGASIGRTAIYDLQDEANINQAVALIRLVNTGLCKEFLLHYLNSSAAVHLMVKSQVITAQPNISLTDVRQFPVPLPPLSEQYRIAAKVDELMVLCDQIETQLADTEGDSRSLLEAVLQEALVP